MSTDIDNTFSIHIFPEGFANNDDFTNAVDNLFDQLHNIAPFNLLKDGVDLYVTAFQYWIESNPNTTDLPALDLGIFNGTGPSEELLPVNRTNFDYYSYELDGDEYYYFNKQKLLSVIELISYTKKNSPSENKIFLKDFIHNAALNEFSFESPSVIIILTPEISSNSILPAYFDIDYATRVYFCKSVSSETSNYTGKWLARAISSNLGLKFEGVFDDYQYPSEPISDADKARVFFSPNLIYIPDLPTMSDTMDIPFNFKWRKYLSSKELFDRYLTVHSRAEQSTANYANTHSQRFYLSLWEGGAGFKNKVYRSGHSCIMQSKFSNEYTDIAFVNDDIDTFCPFCLNFLKDRLGRSGAAVFKYETKNIFNQVSKFDEIDWVKRTWEQMNPDSNNIITIHNNPLNIENEYWDFKVESSSSNPLKIFDIKVRNQQRSIDRIFEEVMDYIDFSDLKIYFAGEENPRNFPVNEIFANNTFYREVGCDGKTPEEGNIYQWGISIDLNHDFEERCIVSVKLSIVFRSLVDDFDPGSAAFALKFFPQITFNWFPSGSNPMLVEKFSGTIKIKSSMHHNLNNPSCGFPSDHNFVEMFSDNNYGFHATEVFWRRHKYAALRGEAPPYDAIPMPYPQWSLLFDYYSALVPFADIDTDVTSFQAVWGPNAPVVNPPFNNANYLQDRYVKGTFNPKDPTLTDNFLIWKTPRQGMFDNIHITGNMGLYDPNVIEKLIGNDVDADPQFIVAAPFCVEDCIHSHWRWGAGLFGWFQGFMVSKLERYRGWGNDLVFSKPFTELYHPLIPPNQDLFITINNSQQTSKILEYKFTVHSPEANSNNVFMEQGIGYAARIADGFDVVRLTLVYLNLIDSISSDLDEWEFMKKLYGRIRFSEPIIDNPGLQEVTTSIPNIGNSIHKAWLEKERNIKG